MRFRLRTLLILMAVLPPLMALGVAWWPKYVAYREQQRVTREMNRLIVKYPKAVQKGWELKIERAGGTQDKLGFPPNVTLHDP